MEPLGHTYYVFVTGGVCSSLGKGVSSASLGCLLEARGFRVTCQKFDPYVNVDPGTMSPYQHGEVYVTEDGAETDLDLGHYERFTHCELTSLNSVTTGQVYREVIERERRGDYLGKTVQVIPHITDEIKGRLWALTERVKPDFQIIEIGGTVGDIESIPFLEAIRQVRQDLGPRRVLYIHLTLIPHVDAADELKTKPTQHSVMKLREIGIQPDVLMCRLPKRMTREMRDKLSLFCDVEPEAVISAPDVKSTIYEIPLVLRREKLDDIVLKKLGLADRAKRSDLSTWRKIVETIKSPAKHVRVGVVGKYIQLQDAYRSIYDAIVHGGVANSATVEVVRIQAEDLEKPRSTSKLRNLSGILVPWGFGKRGTEGKIRAIQFAREHGVPFLGICFGMQMAVVEFARNVCGLKDANSTELASNTPHPVISLLEEQRGVKDLGGTMRLGAYPCVLVPDTLAHAMYGRSKIAERHRHRWEFNNEYRPLLESKGMRVSGTSPDETLVEMIEVVDHPWFIATQFHPELKSRPYRPHPLFAGFIGAAVRRQESA